MRGLLGIGVILLLAWGLSEDRFRVPWRVVATGVLLQFGLALLFLTFPPARSAFLLLNRAVEGLQSATEAGTGFVFGYLGGGQLPFSETQPGASFIFAFRALPLVLVISALATLLFYWGVLQRIVQAFAWVLRRTVGIGGPLGLGAAVHIFVGHIEAPLLIRPYLMRLERGELFALMSCGMAGIAGTVMVLYASLVGSGHSQRARQYPDRGGDQHPGGPRDRRADGAVPPRPCRPGAARARRPAGQRDGRRRQGHPRRHRLPRQHRRDAGGDDRAGQPRQRGARACCRTIAGAPLTLQRLFAYAFRPIMWLIGIPGPETRGRGGADGHQDRAQRVRRLCRSSPICRPRRWARARA